MLQQVARMKILTSSFAALSVLAVTIASAQLVPFADKPAQHYRQPAIDHARQSSKLDSMAQDQPGGRVILSDILGSQKSISIFASFTRDVSSISSRLEAQNTNTTLLAPLNSAISALPRKPWEDQKDYAQLGEQAYLGDGGSQRAAGNLERFVSAHVVPMSPWQAKEKVKTLAGREVWWEEQDDGMVIMPDKILVERVAKQVGNGEVWIIKSVINYEG